MVETLVSNLGNKPNQTCFHLFSNLDVHLGMGRNVTNINYNLQVTCSAPCCNARCVRRPGPETSNPLSSGPQLFE